MARFRRVDLAQAGPGALGILVPPGPRTLVILRPRALAWDLLPARWTGAPQQSPEFCQFDRDEAAEVARGLVPALEASLGEGGYPLESFGDLAGRVFQVWLRAGELVWIVCRRSPGQAYCPLTFASVHEAEEAARRLASCLCPAEGAEQEFYFNTQKFDGGALRTS